jgi:O-antigen ligase
MSDHGLNTLGRRLGLPTWLLRAAIMLVALGYAVLLGLLAGSGRDRLLLVSLLPLAGLIGLSVILYRFQTLVLALPAVALVLPRLEIGTGTATRLPMSLLLALALTGVWTLSMLARNSWRLSPSPLNRPILIFGAIAIVSLGWSLAWRDPGLVRDDGFIVTQLGALATIIVSLTAALLIGNFVTSRRQLAFIIGCFLLFGSLMLVSRLIDIDHGLLNDRGLWGTWLIACAYGLLIAQPGLRWPWRAALALLVLLAFYETMVLTSDWVSGWAPSVVAVLAITLLRSWRAFLLLALVGAAALYGSLGFFHAIAQANIDDGSLERIIIFQQSWRILREHPLLGTGPAGYAVYYMTYFPTEARSTHNNYLDIVAQFGMVGLGIWLWLMAASSWEGWHLSRRVPAGLLRTTAIIATGGWLAALASMLLGDWVLPFAYNQGIAGYKYTVYSWIFLGTLIVVRRLAATEEDRR